MREPTITERREAFFRAWCVRRAANPVEYARKRKLTSDSLPMILLAALFPYAGTECMATAEAKADADVCAKYGWTTMDDLRARSLAELKASMGIE